jgi:hypothetical protein
MLADSNTHAEYVITGDKNHVYAFKTPKPNLNDFTPRYWEGSPFAIKLGPCVVGEFKGTQWGHAGGHKACISEDGVLLRVSDNNGVRLEMTKIVRQALSPSIFKIPANAQVMPWNGGPVLPIASKK